FMSLVIGNNAKFAQLSKKSDRQRFNVAASRAKDQMWLFHSVSLKDMKLECLRYQLLLHCSTAAEETEHLLERELEKCDSEFERNVARRIAARGFKVWCQVKVARYSIDLVVEGADGLQLAVECDGDHWHGPERADEDMQRQRILERSGWQFWRVWGSEFYADPEQALESLWETLEVQENRPLRA
ncbi:MAG: DUF559 domain-containing protein, partial [Planctomycetes bacterium]|nr:DUF559 domain-containing protein [Planctomycetota bacterium]